MRRWIEVFLSLIQLPLRSIGKVKEAEQIEAQIRAKGSGGGPSPGQPQPQPQTYVSQGYYQPQQVRDRTLAMSVSTENVSGWRLPSGVIPNRREQFMVRIPIYNLYKDYIKSKVNQINFFPNSIKMLFAMFSSQGPKLIILRNTNRFYLQIN